MDAKMKIERRDTGSYEIQDEKGICIADIWSPILHGHPQPEVDRLATLFAASEDMLESLKELEALAKNFISTDSDVLVRARAAISKATDCKK